MPCNSEYLNPTGRERELQKAAGLLAYLLRELNQPVIGEITEAAEDIYCRVDYIPSLCQTLTDLEHDAPETFNQIVYNAKNRKARALADWWEEHQEADADRERQELREHYP